MPVQKISTQSLINKATFLFKTQGYFNTSISDIAKACDLSKASIYHHTTSKLDLAITVLKQNYEYAVANYFSILYLDQLSGDERIKRFTNAITEHYQDINSGCIIGNFALEIGGQIKELDNYIQAYFNDWRKALIHILSSKYSEAEAKALAEENISLTQGAIMFSRVDGNSAHIHHAMNKLVDLFKEEQIQACL